MKKLLAIGGIAVVGVGVAYMGVRRMKGGTFKMTMDDKWLDRWRVVTVNVPPDQVSRDGRLPEPLAKLGDLVIVEIRPAPGRRGAELAARLSDPTSGAAKQAIRRVRRALRESKLLLETGEVLQPDKPSTTHPSLLGIPVDIMSRRAREEGRL